MGPDGDAHAEHVMVLVVLMSLNRMEWFAIGHLVLIAVAQVRVMVG
jgi:hypothetical protein